MRLFANTFAILIALTGCAALTRSGTQNVTYSTADAALDCAESVLERAGFQVRGDDIGARSYERNAPGRRAMEVRGIQENPGNREYGYVRVVAVEDSPVLYRLKAYGFTAGFDGTEVRGLLHEQGVSAVVTKCGATR